MASDGNPEDKPALAREVERRIEELNQKLGPLLEERNQLQRMLDALKPGNVRPRLSKEERRREFARLVQERPGLRNKEIAHLVGLTPGRISQVMDGLEDDGFVERRDGAIWPTGKSI